MTSHRREHPEYREYYKKKCQELLKDFQIVEKKGARISLAELEQLLELTRQGLYSDEIAEITGRTPKAIQKTWRRYGFPSLYNLAPPTGKACHLWQGGVSVTKDGYIYRRKPFHPFRNHNGYVREHRLVMEEHLGRYLLPQEVVHHIDDNPSNNDIKNLELFPSNAEHLRVTLAGKCPNWTEEGKKRLAEIAQCPDRIRNSIEAKKKKADARQCKQSSLL